MTRRMLHILMLLTTFHVVRLARADVTPASIFTDHMVLQRSKPVPVWGTAAPGEHVTVSISGLTQSIDAGSDGKWMVRLNNLPTGGPYTLAINGRNALKVDDVYVGEVWLCSGQSNMDFTVAKTEKYYFAGVNNEAEEVAAADYPQIRMFTGQWQKSAAPQAKIEGQWKVCTPANVREFSAIGYFFARDVHKALGVPVGIVTETFGASTAEAWVRREALEPIPWAKARLEKFDEALRSFTDEQRAKYQSARAEWEASVAKAKAAGETKLPRAPRNPDPAQDQHNPTVMYNGMIAPVVPFGIRGVLWYQGESVVDGAEGIKAYPQVQAALVRDWRALWGEPELPFYICQLAALKNRSNNPDIRAAQATILELPHTGMAVTIDIGDPSSVHPKNKQDVGDRLCRIALANAYERDVEYSGPVYQSMQTEGDKIRLRFTHVGGGLVAKGSDGGELTTFQIAGADGKFVPATARVDGETVVVSSPDVPAPAALRYAWVSYPEGCNLYNTAGLPAAPFTTEKADPTTHPVSPSP